MKAQSLEIKLLYSVFNVILVTLESIVGAFLPQLDIVWLNYEVKWVIKCQKINK